jgi:hypothetical protein
MTTQAFRKTKGLIWVSPALMVVGLGSRPARIQLIVA